MIPCVCASFGKLVKDESINPKTLIFPLTISSAFLPNVPTAVFTVPVVAAICINPLKLWIPSVVEAVAPLFTPADNKASIFSALKRIPLSSLVEELSGLLIANSINGFVILPLVDARPSL